MRYMIGGNSLKVSRYSKSIERFIPDLCSPVLSFELIYTLMLDGIYRPYLS